FKRLLHLYSEIIRQVPNPIKVEGFTTEGDAIGSVYPSNWELSGARAAAIVRYFIEEEGLEPERFFIVGNADTKPLNPDDKKSFMNRRVEITILNYGGIPNQQIPSVLDGVGVEPLQGGSRE
ncbi:MAG: OmpA family protein, partial [Campylobacterales bacterium]